MPCDLRLLKNSGKLLISHRYNLLPLLRFRPGGVGGSWSYKARPRRKHKLKTKSEKL